MSSESVILMQYRRNEPQLSEGFLGYVSNGIAHTLSENFPSGRKNDSTTPSLPMPLIDVKIEFKSFLSGIDCVSLNSIKNSSVSVFSFPSSRIEKISAFFCQEKCYKFNVFHLLFFAAKIGLIV